MRALFWLNLRKNLVALGVSVLGFAVALAAMKVLFSVAADDLGFWAALGYVISLLYFTTQATNHGFKPADQWLLLIPRSRKRLVLVTGLSSLLNFALAALNALGCFLLFLFFTHKGFWGQLNGSGASRWGRAWSWGLEAFHKVLFIESPAAVSVMGALALLFSGYFIFGSQSLSSLNSTLGRPAAKVKTRPGREKWIVAGFIAGALALVFFVSRAPHVLPWLLLFAFAFVYPKFLSLCFSLSHRQALHFSNWILRGPALAFTVYFFGMLFAHNLSPQAQHREIASVYTHALVGQVIMPESRKLRLADADLSVGAINAIREEYHDAYDRWLYASDFPVSFAAAIEKKKTLASLEAATEGYDSLDRTDTDVALYLARVAAVRKPVDADPDLRSWRRFHPSEAFTLHLLSSNDEFPRRFGIYAAMNAPSSAEIRATLVRVARMPGISNADLINLADSLSVQFQRETTIAWALRADPEVVRRRQVAAIDCRAFQRSTWQKVNADPAREQFFNVCLRESDSRRALGESERSVVYNSLPRQWIEPGKVGHLPLHEAFSEWQRQMAQR